MSPGFMTVEHEIGSLLSPGPPLLGGVGLGLIGRKLTKNLLKRGWYANNLGEITFSLKFVLPSSHETISLQKEEPSRD
jgi:hypothetical protein